MSLKRHFRSIVTAALILMCGPLAVAGFSVEPYLGYGRGTLDSSLDTDFSFVAAGARVGYGMLGFTGGLDIFKSLTGSFEDDQNDKGDYDVISASVFASYTFPILLRVYAGYTFHYENELDYDSPLFQTSETEGDGGYYLGVGYTGLPFVAVNLEYRVNDFDKQTFENGSSSDLSDTDDSFFMLSVSLPFDF